MSLSTTDDFIHKPSFSISSMAGYFIGNRWTLGLDVGYSVSEITTLYLDAGNGDPVLDNSYTLGQLSITPFARYYFSVGKFAPFVEGGYGMNWYHHGDGIESDNNSTYKIGAGLNYFVTPSLAVEGKFSYSRHEETATTNPISLGFGLQFFLSRNQKGVLKETGIKFLEKGSWMIGGTIDLSISDNEYSDNLYQDYRISPMAGYFLTDKFAMGLTMYYSHLGISDSHIESLAALPFVRYYFGTKRFAPFAEAAFGGSVSKVRYFDGTEQQTSKDENFSCGAAAGFNYFITNSVALETKLSYFKSDNFDQGSLSLQAGLNFFLSRKK